MSRYVNIEPYKRAGWRLVRNYKDKHSSYVEGADLDTIPTAEVTEIKRGRWFAGFGHTYCSVCGYKSSPIMTNYCPNCGARMDVK